MTKTLSLKEARSQFSAIVGRVGRLSERVIMESDEGENHDWPGLSGFTFL